jgi:alkylation response protein AidB-like acyl-CoA dehydrogenase
MSTATLRFEPIELTTDHEQVRADVRAFLAEERAAGTTFGQQSSLRFSPDFSRRLGSRGFIGMRWPKEYGGHQRSALDRYVVTEELLAVGAPVWAHWIADRQSGPLIHRYGTEEQRREFLPRVARGECYFCIGMSEPDSGSDLASIRTRATKVDGGWLLNGTKLWTSWAHHCHYMVALVRTSPPDENRHAGMSQMIVDLKSPNIDIRPVYNLAGEHHFNEEVFADCFVPDAMVIGEVGDGWNQVISELAFERSGPERFLSTFRVFVELVRLAGPHPSDRAAETIGRIAAHLITLRKMSLSVAGMLEQGILPNVEGSVVKDMGTNFAKQIPEIARTLVQAETSIATDAQFDRVMEHAILYSPAWTIQGGTREIVRGIIARGLGLR